MKKFHQRLALIFIYTVTIVDDCSSISLDNCIT
jgi:hypothetical protein